MANIYNFGRFWEENKLDALIWVSYAPNLIANVTVDLDPTFSTINHQLDSTLVNLNKYWHNKRYDKFKIDCRPVFSVNGNSFDGHQELKANPIMTHSILAGEKNVVPDQQLPSGPTNRCLKCKLPYIFSSKPDEDRHVLRVHRSDVLSNKKRKHSSSSKSKCDSKQRNTRKRELSPE
ncbi:unnamed protein product [Didymodactylos carnosus]|uniref:Uncharacterized protein n=1 Tax=Didymodactylos carnosus TaxID=1234261 RepID=A0A815SWY3_9BILA|nr:unnamed protein product [Didymodactylos carnosus]CAF4358115.1 unnamed protein product [Didymodactylos carnosus]